MDLLHLQYFKTVAKTQHITKAAEELMISQSALSKAIIKLEDDLGAALFDRSSSKIKLNSAGEAFLRHTNTIFHELELGRNEVLELVGPESGEVSLATSVPGFLPDLMEQFLTTHRSVRIHQAIMPLPTIKDPLMHGDLDFAFSSSPIDSTGILWTPLLDEEIYLMVPASHRLAGCHDLYLKDFKEDNFICPSAGYGPRNLTDELCAKAGFPPKITFEGTFPEMLGKLVSLQLGVGFISASTAKQFMNSTTDSTSPFYKESVRILKLREPDCRWTIGISRSNIHQLTKAAQRFFHFTINYFKNLQDNVDI